MSLGCARCGACCQDIHIKLTRADITRRLADPYVAGASRRDLEFVAVHWHPEPTTHYLGRTRYQCDAYDPVEARCTAHSARPGICSGYPWYGREPVPGVIWATDTSCSYLLDLPPDARPQGSRPLIPITVV